MTGNEDLIPPSVNSFNMAKEMPSARVVEIRGAGHGLMYQYPAKNPKKVKTAPKISAPIDWTNNRLSFFW